MTTSSDAELAGRARSGDDRAFAELVRRYHGEVYALALRALKNPEDAEDVAQEAFVRAFRALDRFDPERRFGAWMYAITARLSIDAHRRRRGRFVSLSVPQEGTSEEERAWELPDPGAGPAEEVQSTDLAARLEAYVERLPADYRVAILLRHAYELSYEEIAAALDAPVGTVKARIHRARAQLRGWLEGTELDPSAGEARRAGGRGSGSGDPGGRRPGGPERPASRSGDSA